MIKLNEKENASLEEIIMETAAAETTLHVALDFHNNLRKEIKKKELEWWKEVYEQHGLDKNTAYRTVNIDGQKHIVLAVEGEG